MRQIALDTETTGLEFTQGHRIIEMAGVEIINRKLTGNYFHRYINPEREIDEGALQVHGITRDFLQDKSTFSQMAEELLSFIKGAELIIHNASFDIGFINHEMRLYRPNCPEIADYCQIFDTLALARTRHPGQKNSLDALCKRYSIDNSQRHLHGALLDAQLLASVYLAMTGGQGSLFGESSPVAYQLNTTGLQTRKHPALRIIKANPQEESQHTQRLKEIETIAGTS